ncbi:hypothetical protein BJ875DRAFT_511146, partial [Amylocarpus encephaloides]
SEAFFVLDVISSTIAIIDGTKEVHNAESNATGFPAIFGEAVKRLQIVRQTLLSAKQQIVDKKLDEAKSWESKATNIFSKVLHDDGALRADRYTKGFGILRKDRDLETLMRGILEDAQILASNCNINAATTTDLDGIMEAL